MIEWDDEDDDDDRVLSVIDTDTRRPRLLTERCATCIMRPASPVTLSLSPGRLRELLANDTYVVCHSTFPGNAYGIAPALCRGAADTFKSNYVRMCARILGYPDGFTLVDPPSKGDVHA